MNMRELKAKIINQMPFLVGIPAIVWQVMFFYVPLFFIIYLSFTRWDGQARNYMLSLFQYKSLIDWVFVSVIARSLALGLFNAFVCLIAAYPLAYFIAFKTNRFKTFFLFLLIVPFWTNFLLHIYAWFYVLERNGFLNMALLRLGIIQEPLALMNSLGAVLIVMFYCYLPFMVLPIYAILDKFDTRLFEASADLGANQFRTFFNVTLPLTLPGLVTGFFLVFIPSFSEFVIPALMGGDRTMFAGSLITYLFLNGNNQPLGAAFALISSIIILLLIVSIYGILKRLTRSL